MDGGKDFGLDALTGHAAHLEEALDGGGELWERLRLTNLNVELLEALSLVESKKHASFPFLWLHSTISYAGALHELSNDGLGGGMELLHGFGKEKETIASVQVSMKLPPWPTFLVECVLLLLQLGVEFVLGCEGEETT
jgi:hypothetical protein